MSHWSYLAVLGFILLGTLWLEVVVRTRVLRKTRRLLLSVLPVAGVVCDLGLVRGLAGAMDF